MAFDIPLFDVNFDDREVEAVASTVRSGWISMGKNVAELERQMAERLGVGNVVAVSSCTAALHLAMVANDIGPGDEVIVPSLTFVASANAVRYVGATPVFADIESLERPTLCPRDVERKLTAKTRAILPVHYAGFPCDMDALMTLARDRELVVVEDAAHTIDVPFGDGKLGALGDVGCFSLFSNKVITSGEGGLVATGDDELAARVRLLRSHGMTTMSFDRARGHASSYDVVAVGYNYRIDDIRAALALAQLGKLDEILEQRAALRHRYVDALRDVDGLALPFDRFDTPSANYILPVLVEEGGASRRDAVREHLREARIQTSVHYPPVHRFEVHADDESLPVTEQFCDSELTLPFYERMTADQVDRVVEVLAEALRSV